MNDIYTEKKTIVFVLYLPLLFAINIYCQTVLISQSIVIQISCLTKYQFQSGLSQQKFQLHKGAFEHLDKYNSLFLTTST